MKLRHSDIFEDYAKISLDQGLIKEAEEKTNPRNDSQDLSAIELLYGVKPNPEEKKDILDQAHPKPVIISPAHDKVNGLVENLKERQNVMVGIATKPNNGMLTNHIYAQANELLDELLKLGCFLDNKNDLELMKLADSCSERLSKKAFVFLGIGALGWAAITALTATYLSNNFGGMIDQGVNKNAERAVVELNDLLTDFFEADKYKGIHLQVTEMIKNINYVRNLGNKASVLSLPKPSLDNITDASHNETYKKAQELLDEYAEACQTLGEYMPVYIELLKNNVDTDSADPNWWAAVKSVYHLVMPTEIKDAITAMETLQNSLLASSAEIAKRKTAIQSYVENNKQDIFEKAKSKMEQKSNTGSIEDKIKAKHQEPMAQNETPDEVDEVIKSLQ